MRAHRGSVDHHRDSHRDPAQGHDPGGHDTLVAWPEARARAARVVTRVDPARPAVRVPLADAAGCTLVEDLVARVGVPGFDAAAMDGYAVCGTGPWTVVGAGLAGAPSPVAGLVDGQAVEIATGAPVPAGTNAVLPYEDAERTSDMVVGTVVPGRHVRRAGEDIAPGARVLPAGAAVTPAALGAAAGLGHDDLLVARPLERPRVAVLVTGDEVRHAGLPGRGEVRDAIGPMLPGLVAWAGGTLDAVRYLPDDHAALRSAITSRLAAAASPSGTGRGAAHGSGGLGAVPGAGPGPEVICVCGASSAGPADHLRPVLAELGAETIVDGVACRPGHPQLLALLSESATLVVGLPGNPYAALVAALTLLVPALAGLAGRPDPALMSPRVLPVQGEVRPHLNDTRLAPVRVEGDAAGGRAVALGHDRPGSLRGAASADALAVLAPGWTGPAAELLWLPR